jgi:hypothetical protein
MTDDSPIPDSEGYDCARCGARYRGRDAALVCCVGGSP